MRVRRRVLVAVAIMASVPLVSTAASAGPPADPGCPGRIVALFNHNSGLGGASGNPESSAGPGYFFHQGTAAAVDFAMSLCGPI